MPVVCWGDDVTWSRDSWHYKPIRRRYALDDPVQILQNVYRVLLTRGRDGCLIWVPPDERFTETRRVLLEAGVTQLNIDDAEQPA
jgi:DUF2075 family protein